MSTLVYVIFDGDPDGPIDRLARAIGDGALSVADTQVILHRPPQVTVDQMVAADAIILGSPNWHGMTADLKGVVDLTGAIWEQGKLVGKAGSAFAGSSQAHGGNESTVISLWNPLAHLGFIIVPTGYADGVMFAGAGSPYGASVISGHPPAGPSEAELAVARFQGKRVAQVAKKLIAAT
jgi:NAD(P)H dehydrogenase (quinone)